MMNKYSIDDTIETDYEWIGLDPNRPVSDISHRDYTNGIVYYREYGPYKGETKTVKWEFESKYTDIDIEELFPDFVNAPPKTILSM
jgi:hypothetical protein